MLVTQISSRLDVVEMSKELTWVQDCLLHPLFDNFDKVEEMLLLTTDTYFSPFTSHLAMVVSSAAISFSAQQIDSRVFQGRSW